MKCFGHAKDPGLHLPPAGEAKSGRCVPTSSGGAIFCYVWERIKQQLISVRPGAVQGIHLVQAEALKSFTYELGRRAL